MKSPLDETVRAPAPPHHADNAHYIRRGGNQRREEGVEAEGFDDLRQEETQSIVCGYRAEVHEAKPNHSRVHERLHHGVAVHALPMSPLGFQSSGKPVTLVGSEPGSFRGAIGEIKKHHAGKKNRGNGLDDEQPLPTGEPEPAMQIQKHPGYRRADHRREWNGGHEVAYDSCPVLRWEPQGQIEDDAWKEPGLGRAQQHAQKVEAVLVAKPGDASDAGNERHSPRQDAPAQHDARDPFASTETLQEQVRWNLENEIGDKEDTRSKTECGL